LDKPGQRTTVAKFKWGVSAPKSILENEALAIQLTCLNENKNSNHDFPVNDMEALLWKVGEKDKITKVRRLRG
jgi:hypothetical protein